MQSKIVRTLLPFATPSQPTKVPFTKDAERAAIFCLAEVGRGKGGGFFRKRPPERLVSIAEVYYPFWITQFGRQALFYDGLNLASHTINYPVLPNLKAFEDEMNFRSKTRQAYVTFLSSNLTYFQPSESIETKVISGLITDADFLRQFMPYLNEAATTDAPVIDSVIVSPTNNETELLAVTRDLENMRVKFAAEVTELNGLIKLLNRTTQDSLSMLREEVKKTEKQFIKPVEEAKAALENRTAQINQEYTEKITATSNQFEQEMLTSQKELVALEKTAEHLTAEIEHCEAEIKTAAINKNYVSEQKWKEKRSELKKENSEIQKKTEAAAAKIRQIEESKQHALFQLKAESDAKIKEAKNDLINVESTRDAETRVYRGEMEKLEELTAGIIKQISQTAKMREAAIAEFDNLGVPHKKLKHALVHMPFYLARHQAGSNRRYTFFAPSIVGNVGVSAKLRSAIGKMKVSRVLQPRSKGIVSLLNKFVVLLEEDVAFGSEINEACRKANLLETESLRQSIMEGLDKLKESGWLSEQERDSFGQVLA